MVLFLSTDDVFGFPPCSARHSFVMRSHACNAEGSGFMDYEEAKRVVPRLTTLSGDLVVPRLTTLSGDLDALARKRQARRGGAGGRRRRACASAATGERRGR